MTGKTHRIIGIGSGITYFLASSQPHYSPATLASVLVGSYFASLIPDLDRSTSSFWDSIPLGETFGKIVDPLIKHRNISHSILGAAIFSIAVYYIFNLFPAYWGIDVKTVIFSSIIAYCSHLLADMFTIEGIPLFYPSHRPFGIPPKPFDGIRIVTGKWFENLLLFPLLNAYLIILIITKWKIIKLIIFK